MEGDPLELRAIRSLLHHDGGWEPAPGDAGPADALLHRGLAGLAVVRWPVWLAALPAPARHRFEGAYRATALRNVLLLESLDRARAALAEVGVRSRAFKGAALLEAGVWPDPGARPMGDVDLLVARRDAPVAIRTLSAAEFRRWTPPDDGSLEWGDAATFEDPRTEGEIAATVDLHWRVGRGGLRFGAPGLEDRLLAGPGGTPPTEVHFLHIAEHVVRHLRVLSHLHGVADLVRLAPRVEGWDDVAAMAATGPLAPAVAALLALLRDDLGAVVPPGIPEEVLSRSGGLPVRLGLEDLVDGGPAGRLDGLRQRWRWTGRGRRAFAELVRTAVPRPGWLRARYSRTPAFLRLLHFWAHGAAWLAGAASSPASPNQRFEPPSRRPAGRPPSGRDD